MCIFLLCDKILSLNYAFETHSNKYSDGDIKKMFRKKSTNSKSDSVRMN